MLSRRNILAGALAVLVAPLAAVKALVVKKPKYAIGVDLAGGPVCTVGPYFISPDGLYQFQKDELVKLDMLAWTDPGGNSHGINYWMERPSC